MEQENLKSFLENLEKSLTNFKPRKPDEKVKNGVIQSYKDGVIVVKSLKGVKMGEVIKVEGTDTKALVMNLEQDNTYALVIQGKENLREAMLVIADGETLSIPVSDKFIGRVVDPLGFAIDGGPELESETRYPIEKIAPGVMTRKSVHQPLQTGILAIDALIPIGRGQRELIIGDRQTGKTAIAIDTIINQKDQNIICIYVSIAQRESETANIYETLKHNGALEYSLIVSAPASTSASLQFLAPFSGMALAEYFMDKGKDVLIIFDDLSKHAVAYREMSLLLRRPPGREAYPGDVFYLHSRLLERAAKLNEQNGGGSITALPIIETQAGDVSAYIPTNVISITDGQIFLQSDLFYKGIRPAINVGISVSRVGGAAQTKIMKKVSGTAKLDLTQYYELEAFSQFASELEESTKKQLVRGKRVVIALKQKENRPYKLWQEVTLLFASTKGYLDKIEEKDCPKMISEMFAYIESNETHLINEIEQTKEFSPTVEKGLKAAMEKIFI